ncbi:MAG: hypothetical protein Kow0069_05550 [Promethearchaeota archaeon]
MSSSRWHVKVAAALLAVSTALYVVDFLAFHDAEFIEHSFFNSLAYTPIQVMFVTLFLNLLLKREERKNRLNALYKVIGIFFSEVGTQLLAEFHALLPFVEREFDLIHVSADWSDSDFDSLYAKIKERPVKPDLNPGDFHKIRSLLAENKPYFVRMLEHPNLIEHEEFTDMLYSLFHLCSELALRHHFDALPNSDRAHLQKEVAEAYKQMIQEWIFYLKHLKREYPNLYSLAVRTNPFKGPVGEADVLVDDREQSRTRLN